MTVGVGLLIIAYFVFGRSEPAPATINPTRGTVTQEVSVTGKTKSMQEIDLAFEKSGRIIRVNASVGTKVFAGQALVELDASETLAQLAEAKATALSQNAKLDELIKGPRPTDVELKRTDLAKALQDVDHVYENVPDELQEAYTDTDDAIRKQIDLLFINDEQTNPQLSFPTTNSQNQINSETGRQKSSSELNAWKLELLAINSSKDRAELDKAIVNAKNRLTYIRNFLTNLMDATVNATSLSSDTLTTYKASVNTARTSVNTALVNVTAKEQAIQTAIFAAQKAQNELDKTLAGNTPEAIASQQALVQQAEANIANIQAQLSKTVLRSPINGVVTTQDAKTGQIASPNTIITSVISENQLEIEANVPEVDIGKVATGKPVRITFDALADEVFSGTIARVDPAETIVEGVSTYKTTVALNSSDVRIKSGMTANMDILVDEHTDALSVPQRSVYAEDGKKYVTIILPNGTEEVREVKTGLRGQNGEIEIISGLTQSDTILKSPK